MGTYPGLVSIVLPAYNEEKAIGELIDSIHQTMDKAYQYEIVVVDDCSTDRTAEIAKAKGVRVVERAVTGGSGAARKVGIQVAKGEVIVMLDADGTYSPKDIPKLLEYLPKFDQVNGARTTEQGTLKLLRMPVKWAIKKFACILAGTDIPDLNTGFKAFKKDIMLKYLWAIPDGFSCVTSMTLAFLCNGYTVKYVPIEYHPRIGESKFHPVWDTANYLSTVLRMIMYFNPLKIFLPLSIGLFLLGLGKAIQDIFIGVIIRTTYIDIVLMLTGMMVGVLGLLADLLVAQGKARRNAYPE